MDYFAISALINFILSVWLAWFVFFKNPQNKLNRNLLYLYMSAAVWSGFYFLWQTEPKSDQALLWTRFLMIGAAFIPYFYLKVIILFLEQYDKYKKILNILFIPTVLFASLMLTPLMINGLKSVDGFRYWPSPGPLYIWFLAFFLGLGIYGYFLSYKALPGVSAIKRKKIKIILIGMVISLAGGSTNYFLWYDIPIKPYGNILSSLYVFLTIYAIVRYRALNIKLIFKQSTIYFVSLTIILFITSLIGSIISKILPLSTFLHNLILLAIALFIYQPIKNKTTSFANKYFFTSLYDTNEVISKLSDNLRSIIKIEKLLHVINKTIDQTFHATRIGILVFDENKNTFNMIYNSGFKAKETSYKINNKTVKLLLKQNRCISVDEIKDIYKNKMDDIVHILEKYKIDILVPLIIKNKLIGLIVLGKKEDQSTYNTQDYQVLEIIRSQIAIALENALLYEESISFSKKLQEEVKKATKELRQANKKLRKFDKLKTEFLSIASHQLRTPLSGIKGYMSMILDGDFGKFTDEQMDVLKRVKTEVDRLIRMVQVFLNVSRIESGRLFINNSPFNLCELINDVVEELTPTAQNKNIKIILNKPEEDIIVDADSDKIKDVVVNLIDNAIKYTPEGKIEITVKKTNSHAKVQVKDTGIGIDKEEIDELFSKFKRAKGVSEISPGGSGLGLFIAKKIIEAHKGKIWVESEGVGRGSVFTFILPIKFIGKHQRKN